MAGQYYRGVAIPPGVEVVVEDGVRVVKIHKNGSDGRDFVVTMSFPDSIKHPYGHVRPDEPIVLHRGEFVLLPSEESRVLDGVALLEWRPVPRLEASGRPSQPAGLPDIMDLLDAPIGEHWTPIPWLELRHGDSVPNIPFDGDGSSGRIDNGNTWLRNDLREFEINASTPIESVSFAIANGWDALDGRRVAVWNSPWNFTDGHFEVVMGEFRCSFEALRDHKDRLATIGRYGGTIITHLGRIVREDGARFVVEDVKVLFATIRLSMRLATGRAVDAVLPVGHVAGEAQAFAWWVPRVDDYRTAHSLLDPTCACRQIARLLEKVQAFTISNLRRSILYHAVSYYLGANRGTNIQLACSQVLSGLQLLSYYHLVAEGDLSKSDWDKMGLDTQIRHILEAGKIQTEVTPGAGALARAGANLPNPSTDALSILIKMRNTIVHPGRDTTDRWDHYEWYEAWCAARELLLLAVLHMVGYDDEYRSILQSDKWLGVLDRLPWSEGSSGESP